MNTRFSFEDEIDLGRFDPLYRTEAVEPGPVSSLIPDGRYEVTIVEASLQRSQRSGNPMIRWVLRITGATYRDRLLRKHSAITENTIRFVRRDLETCGLRLERFSDLSRRIGELEGLELEVVKVTKGEDSNIYFNRSLTARSQADGVADDDLPF